jgi:hypothetical protein
LRLVKLAVDLCIVVTTQYQRVDALRPVGLVVSQAKALGRNVLPVIKTSNECRSQALNWSVFVVYSL